jgi:hypothetical protein
MTTPIPILCRVCGPLVLNAVDLHVFGDARDEFILLVVGNVLAEVHEATHESSPLRRK